MTVSANQPRSIYSPSSRIPARVCRVVTMSYHVSDVRARSGRRGHLWAADLPCDRVADELVRWSGPRCIATVEGSQTVGKANAAISGGDGRLCETVAALADHQPESTFATVRHSRLIPAPSLRL